MDLHVLEFNSLFPSLEELDLCHCNNWSDVGGKLASNNQNLRSINLDGLLDFSMDALSDFVTFGAYQFPRL